MPTPRSTARFARSAASPPSGSVSHEKKPPRGVRPARPRRHEALERGEHALALAPVERARLRELLVDPAAAHVLLEEPLPERARALVGVLLRRDELRGHLGGSDRPAEPHAGKERLRRRPGLHDDVRREAPQARQRVAVEAELAVGDVLDDQEAVPPRELDEERAPLGREADAGRVLVVGDRVEELRAQPAGETPLELVDLQPVLVHRHGDDLGLEAAERHDRAEIRRAFDDDDVAAVEERLARRARAPRSRRS